MAISVRYTKSVVFILGGGSAAEAVLRGTGFVAGTPTEDENIVIPWLVTAAHVVRWFAYTAVRLSQKDGSAIDHPIELSDWRFHDTEDLAICLLHSLDASKIEVSPIPVEEFVGAKDTEFPVGVGDTVFFGGLLGQVPSMGEGNVPMIRSGAIGALHQNGVPMRAPDDTVIHVRGHLIDCRSFGGFSGSPCFVQFISGKHVTENFGFTAPIESTHFLGIVGGHFDLGASVTLPDQEGKLKIPVSAGIAVVYPSELVAEMLNEAAGELAPASNQ